VAKKSGSKWLTIVEVCEELSVARSTFDMWRRLGTGPKAIRLPNRQVRVEREELDRWLENLEVA